MSQQIFFFESGKCWNFHIFSALWQYSAETIEGRKLFAEIQYLLNKQPRFSDFLHLSPCLHKFRLLYKLGDIKLQSSHPYRAYLKMWFFFLSKKWVLGTLSENSINQLTLFCLSPTAVATSSYLVVQNVSGQSLQLWQYWLWSFQGRDKKLERFLAKNQL